MEISGLELNGTLSLEDYSFILNDSSISLSELECLLTYYNVNFDERSCNTTYDGISCWPPTKAESFAVIQCMGYLNNVPYDTTQNATRECYENGTWALRSDYSRCRPLHQSGIPEVLWDVKDAHTIYSIGYGLSLIALSIALFIFIYFRDLRCQRNTIHIHLLVTYLFINLTWIITAALQTSTSSTSSQVACYLVILLTYLMVTNFFWMFVEGLYLYMLVVKTFSVEKIKLHTYVFIGWGIPAIVILIWAIVKSQLENISTDQSMVIDGCPWQNKDHFDYIFMCPVIVVLLINIYFLGRIMWVLITKLRAATSVESKQYRVRIKTDNKTSVSNYQMKKAAKALLVLIPLLGVTYIVVIVTPTHRIARVIFSYAQATLLSTQGFTVAVLYCFLNGEVRKSLRHHLEQWRDQRGLSSGRRQLRLDDSRGTDSGIRMYANRGVRDRASCTSLSTSGTWLSNNYKTPSKPANGSYSPVPEQDDNI